jgi:molybdopterin converting factor small subunit
LRQWAGGQKLVEVQPGSVGEAIDTLCRQYPGVAERVRDEDGQTRQFVNIYLNGEDIRFLDGPGTAVRDGDELIIAPAVAGG